MPAPQIGIARFDWNSARRSSNIATCTVNIQAICAGAGSGGRLNGAELADIFVDLWLTALQAQPKEKPKGVTMQRILITGANRGIGFELARTCGLLSRKTP